MIANARNVSPWGLYYKTPVNVHWQPHLQENSISELKRVCLQYSIMRIYNIQDYDFKRDVFGDQRIIPEITIKAQNYFPTQTRYTISGHSQTLWKLYESPGGTTEKISQDESYTADISKLSRGGSEAAGYRRVGSIKKGKLINVIIRTGKFKNSIKAHNYKYRKLWCIYETNLTMK